MKQMLDVDEKQKTTHSEYKNEAHDDVDDPDDFGGSEWWISASVTLKPGLSREISTRNTKHWNKHQHE